MPRSVLAAATERHWAEEGTAGDAGALLDEIERFVRAAAQLPRLALFIAAGRRVGFSRRAARTVIRAPATPPEQWAPGRPGRGWRASRAMRSARAAVDRQYTNSWPGWHGRPPRPAAPTCPRVMPLLLMDPLTSAQNSPGPRYSATSG